MLEREISYGQREPNRAVGEVARVVRESGQPFTYDQKKVLELLKTGEQPFLDALQGFSFPVQARLLEGVQTLTFEPVGTVASRRKDAGH